jgi:hypothetical protein
LIIVINYKNNLIPESKLKSSNVVDYQTSWTAELDDSLTNELSYPPLPQGTNESSHPPLLYIRDKRAILPTPPIRDKRLISLTPLLRDKRAILPTSHIRDKRVISPTPPIKEKQAISPSPPISSAHKILRDKGLSPRGEFGTFYQLRSRLGMKYLFNKGKFLLLPPFQLLFRNI